MRMQHKCNAEGKKKEYPHPLLWALKIGGYPSRLRLIFLLSTHTELVVENVTSPSDMY